MLPLRSFLILLAVAFSLKASAELSFTADKVDFGTIYEADGKKTKRIYATNTGDSPLTIVKISPTCGCTAVSFDRDPIMPGDSAWIDLVYNPYRRPGRFEKAVKVQPSEGELIHLPITGLVVATPESVDHLFPSHAGLLRVSETHFHTLRPISKVRSFYCQAYNDGDKPVYISVDSDDGPSVDAVYDEEPLMPGETMRISIYVNPQLERTPGLHEYKLRLYTATDASSLKNAEPTLLTINTEIAPRD